MIKNRHMITVMLLLLPQPCNLGVSKLLVMIRRTRATISNISHNPMNSLLKPMVRTLTSLNPMTNRVKAMANSSRTHMQHKAMTSTVSSHTTIRINHTIPVRLMITLHNSKILPRGTPNSSPTVLTNNLNRLFLVWDLSLKHTILMALLSRLGNKSKDRDIRTLAMASRLNPLTLMVLIKTQATDKCNNNNLRRLQPLNQQRMNPTTKAGVLVLLASARMMRVKDLEIRTRNQHPMTTTTATTTTTADMAKLTKTFSATGTPMEIPIMILMATTTKVTAIINMV